MSSSHIYTITGTDGKTYVGICPWYRWAKVELHFGIPREHIQRGGDLVHGRSWDKHWDEFVFRCDGCGEIINIGEEEFIQGNGGCILAVCPTCNESDEPPLVAEEWRQNTGRG